MSLGDTCHDNFLDAVMRNDLNQIITEPTRLDNILDLLLTSTPMLVSNVNIVEPFTHSCDHNAIEFSINIQSEPLKTNKNKYNFRKADFESIADYVQNVDWLSVYRSTKGNVETFWKSICSTLDYCIEAFVPKFKQSKRKTKCPKIIRSLALKKRSLYRKSVSDISKSSKAAYIKVSKEYDAAVKKFNLQREQTLLEDPSLAKFYSFINSKLQSTLTTPTLTDDNGNIIADPKEKANNFNTYFSTVFTEDDGIIPNVSRLTDDQHFLSNITFTYSDVLRKILDLPSKTSRTPDGFPAFLLKNIATAIAFPLSILFELSFTQGILPDIWKTALIIPIYKKGKPSSCENYRPVSLTCISCKVMESIIVSQMLIYLRKYNLLTKEQYGFLSRRSTCTQLIDTLHTWSEAINKRQRVDSVYIDFSKAFDTVSHTKLLLKLNAYGFEYEILNWIASFLQGRSQIVCVEFETSSPEKVISGVPQGSVLGPLLFILFINDIITCLEEECQIKLFADDAKIFSCRSVDNIHLSKSLENLCQWAKTWQLRIAFEKCAVLTVGNTKVPARNYNLSGHQLNQVNQIRDLGVIITSDLKSSAHCSMIAAKAYARAHLIMKCFTSRNPEILIKAYTTYVRPLLENASPVWNPHLIKDINVLEKVQRNFTRRINYFRVDHPCYQTYTERLNAYNLETLESRRVKHDLILMYKLTHNLVDLDINSLCKIVNNKYDMRGNSKKLKPSSIPKLESVKYEFCNRVIPKWNALTEECVSSKTVSAFKQYLKNANLHQYCTITTDLVKK